MRKAMLALLAGAYLCMSLAAGALVWRGGTDWGAGASVMAACLALCFGVHNVIAHGFDVGALRRELTGLRDAHHILADHLEETEGALEELAVQLQSATTDRAHRVTGEVKMLEALVARMGHDLEARLARPIEVAGPAHHRQHAALLDTVREALSENRVDLYLQPIVSLPQRRVAFYESFTRLRDATGRVMMPAEFLTVAEPEGLVGAIDNLLLFRCVQIIRRLGKNDRRVGIFCNLSLASLRDQAFFPQFIDFLADHRDLASALIFEIGQAAFEARGTVEARNMFRLAELGFRFSIDKVTDLDLDFAELHRADVRFIKIAASVLLAQLVEVDGRVALRAMPDIEAADFAGMVRRFGVEPIVEKVESEREVIDILELDLGYGQGNLFGEPRPIRDDVLIETAPPPSFLRNAPLRAAGAAR